jgi:hypothetical protein
MKEITEEEENVNVVTKQLNTTGWKTGLLVVNFPIPLHSVFRIRIWTGSGFNWFCGSGFESGSGSGSKKAKLTHKSRKSEEISFFEVFDVLFGWLDADSLL